MAALATAVRVTIEPTPARSGGRKHADPGSHYEPTMRAAALAFLLAEQRLRMAGNAEPYASRIAAP